MKYLNLFLMIGLLCASCVHTVDFATQQERASYFYDRYEQITPYSIYEVEYTLKDGSLHRAFAWIDGGNHLNVDSAYGGVTTTFFAKGILLPIMVARLAELTAGRDRDEVQSAKLVRSRE